MIIEAGYDLHLLLFPDHSPAGGLRMVCLDADLRVTDVRTLIPAFTGVFDHSALDSIEAAIPEDDDLAPQLDTRFVGLGYRVTAISGYPDGFDWERVKAVEERLARRGIQLLGIQVCDDESWASTGPMYSFESYALDDLPRAIVIPGPHPFASCECVACAPKRQRLRSVLNMTSV